MFNRCLFVFFMISSMKSNGQEDSEKKAIQYKTKPVFVCRQGKRGRIRSAAQNEYRNSYLPNEMVSNTSNYSAQSVGDNCK